MCACVCVCAFMLYALNSDNMYLQRTCKRLGPVWVRRSKYSLLLLVSGGHVENTRSRNMSVKAVRVQYQVELLRSEYTFTKHVCQSCESTVSGRVVT